MQPISTNHFECKQPQPSQDNKLYTILKQSLINSPAFISNYPNYYDTSDINIQKFVEQRQTALRMGRENQQCMLDFSLHNGEFIGTAGKIVIATALSFDTLTHSNICRLYSC